MNKIKWLGMGCLILCLMLGNLHCAGKKSQLKMEPSEKPPQTVASQPSPEITMPSPKPGEVPPAAVAEAPKPETPPQPPIQPRKPDLPTPSPVAPPSAPSSPPAKSPEAPKGPGVVFNFDNADLYEVIRVMAEILKINYVIDPKVKGVVNIHTVGQIPAEEVFPIFQSILRLNGATAVKKDNVYEIVPFADAKKSYILPSIKEPGRLPAEERYTTQIIILKYIPVAEVSKLIKPFLSDGADMIEHPPHNILIVNDLASNIRKALDIINLFDVDVFAHMKVRIYPILNADVTEIAKEMERIFSSFEVSTKSGRGVGITFTPVTRINSLLVISSIPNIFDRVEGWLKELDKTPAEGTKLGVFVYYVQNAKAKDLAEVLKQIFVAAKEKKAEFREKVTAPTPEPTPRGVKPTTPAAPAAPAKEEAAAVPEGEINIVVDETNNALVIRAFQRDYRSILETIKKLDIYPKQVLIETMLAEITLDDTTSFGIEWSRFLTSNPPNAQEVTVQGRPPTDPFALAAASAPQVGIRYSIVELGGRVAASIQAAAVRGKVNVISSPNILASNNKEAKIQVGTSQPILTNTYTTTATATTGVVEGTIEYKDVGIIVTLTPRISDGGLVTLEISIEDSSVAETSLGTLENIPVFRKKTTKTVLSVLEGQMIVIGGLISNERDTLKSGIPLLSRIPLLGALFGTQRYVARKTELIFLMTPHIITDHMQSKSVTDEFKGKIEGIKKRFEDEKKK
jgi:general secretion pathway protein D